MQVCDVRGAPLTVHMCAEGIGDAQGLSAWSFDGSTIGGGGGGNEAVLSPLVKSLQSRLERAEEQ